MISNAKRNLLGINHQIKDDYLKNYLNEFYYKTNRRYYCVNLFDRLMIAAVEDTWYGKNWYNYGQVFKIKIKLYCQSFLFLKDRKLKIERVPIVLFFNKSSRNNTIGAFKF